MQTQKQTRKFLEVIAVFSTLVVVLPQVYAYVQTQQAVYIKWVQLFAYLLYLKKAKKGTTYILRIKYYSEKM